MFQTPRSLYQLKNAHIDAAITAVQFFVSEFSQLIKAEMKLHWYFVVCNQLPPL